jgi:peptide/nickel transport system ATP-binding protein
VKSSLELLEISDLSVTYQTRNGNLDAVDKVSFSLGERETLGIVGESGCGKTTLGRAIIKMIDKPGRITGGSVRLEGKEILSLDENRLRKIRGKEIAMIFQDPMTSLNPVKRIGEHYLEEIRTHLPDVSKEEAMNKVKVLLSELGIPEDRLNDYPHQFSGGMKQRVMIGLALALDPKLLIADEPTTSLDVIVEAQILELIKKLKESRSLSMILITHNLGVVAEVADKIAIMYAGRIVEYSSTISIFEKPLHPYTKLLLKLVPNVQAENASLQWIPGSPPDLTLEQVGCRFAPRCPSVFPHCRNDDPRLVQVEPGHYVACHLYN